MGNPDGLGGDSRIRKTLSDTPSTVRLVPSADCYSLTSNRQKGIVFEMIPKVQDFAALPGLCFVRLILIAQALK